MMNGKKAGACLFLLVVLFFSAMNVDIWIEPVRHFADETAEFEQIRNGIQSAFLSDFFMKNTFVNLNGAFSRLIGKREVNDVILTNNDMLVSKMGFINMEPISLKIIELEKNLSEKGIPFLFVQAPYKMDLHNNMMPVGKQDFSNVNVDHLMGCLRDAGVKCLDLREMLCATPETVKENFFVTDHHWNIKGAFSGYKEIVLNTQNLLADTTDVSMYIDEANWEKKEIKDHFLGSLGRRIGQWYIGMDDFVYYIPIFGTDMSCTISDLRSLTKGDFSETIIKKHYLERGKDHFSPEGNAYAVYVGDDYGQVVHRNKQPVVHKKLLIIKDSYALPIQAFLSTIYEEIYVIDPRHFTECSILEYICRIEPDAVMMLLFPGSYESAIEFNWGSWDEKTIRDEQLFSAELIFESEKIYMESSSSKFRYVPIFDGFKADTAYTLSIEDACILEGEADGFSIALYDDKTKKNVIGWAFDLDKNGKEAEYEWKFRTKDEDCSGLQLILYSGLAGNTSDVGIEYQGIKLYQGYRAEN